MNSNSIYTRKTFGLDKTVWLVMLAAIIIPSGLLSYTLISKKDCVPVKFTFSSFSTHAGNIFRTDETISFNASSKDITWDFGDHSGNAYGQYFEHKFLSQGDYYVKAKSDLGCDTIQKIVIVKPKQDSIIEITGPDNTVTGSTVYFKYPVKANHYEWSVTDHTGFVIQKTPTAKFIFPVKGTYTIQVNLDNDPTKRATKVILVDEATIKPISSGDVKVLIPESIKYGTTYISDETFREKMNDVKNGTTSLKDFNAYLCDLGKTPVTIKGKDEKHDFAWACTHFSNAKKGGLFNKHLIKIKKVTLTRQGDCVTLIDIAY